MQASQLPLAFEGGVGVDVHARSSGSAVRKMLFWIRPRCREVVWIMVAHPSTPLCPPSPPSRAGPNTWMRSCTVLSRPGAAWAGRTLDLSVTATVVLRAAMSMRPACNGLLRADMVVSAAGNVSALPAGFGAVDSRLSFLQTKVGPQQSKLGPVRTKLCFGQSKSGSGEQGFVWCNRSLVCCERSLVCCERSLVRSNRGFLHRNRSLVPCKRSFVCCGPNFGQANEAWFRAIEVWFRAIEVWFRANEVWFQANEVWFRTIKAWFRTIEVWFRAVEVWFRAIEGRKRRSSCLSWYVSRWQ